MQQHLIDRYLSILGVSRREPTRDALFELVRSHMLRIPFENLSKIYYRKHQGLIGLPGLELFLEGIERFNLGGTCYANNFHIHELLANLGYQVMLCGADMSNPDVHVVNIVNSEGRDYLVDVGYAAPFLTPLPRDLKTDYCVSLGSDQYILRPQDSRGYSHLEFYRNGTPRHGYWVKPFPRQIGEFDRVIAGSFDKSATFMNALLMTRFFPDRSIVIRNLSLMESHGTVTQTRGLASLEELAQAVHDHFAIPLALILDVVNEFERLEDPWE
ncbi:MAG TPA: arylamine N-acetyltransferase [Terriglobia bacterium]|nr:arylamine N-acetyltransferase [Terriglobia bacterium]